MIEFYDFESSINDSYKQGLLNIRFASYDNETGQHKPIGVYDLAAMVRMVRDIYPKSARKGNHRGKCPYQISAIINKIVYWHEFSRRKNPDGDGSFYKSRKAWETEMDLSRYVIEAAEEFLIDLSCLKTYSKTVGNTYGVKHWELDKDYLQYIFNVYSGYKVYRAGCEKDRVGCEKDVYQKWNAYYNALNPHIEKISENSSYFRLFIEQNSEFSVHKSGHPLVTSNQPPWLPVTNPLVTSNQHRIIHTNSTDRINRLNTFTSVNVFPHESQGSTLRFVQGDGSADASPLLERPVSGLIINIAGDDIVSLTESNIYGEFTPESKGQYVPVHERKDIAVRRPSDRMLPVPTSSTLRRFTGESVPMGTPTPVKPVKRGKFHPTTFEEQAMLEIVEEWNNLPLLPDSLDTKLTQHSFDYSGKVNTTMKHILERLVLINKGKFYSEYPNVKTWSSSTSLDDSLFHVPVPVATLKAMLHVYREYFEPCKGVANKGELATSLTGFLGCYEKKRREGASVSEHRSWFWELLHRGSDVPEIVDYTAYMDEAEQKHGDVVEQLKQRLKLAGSRDRADSARYITGKLFREYDVSKRKTIHLYSETNANYNEIMASFPTFAYKFFDYIAERNFDKVFPGHYDTEKRMYKNWADHVRASYGIVLYPTKVESRMLAKDRAETLLKPAEIVRGEDGKLMWYSEEEIDLIKENNLIAWWDIQG